MLPAGSMSTGRSGRRLPAARSREFARCAGYPVTAAPGCGAPQSLWARRPPVPGSSVRIGLVLTNQQQRKLKQVGGATAHEILERIAGKWLVLAVVLVQTHT